MPGKLFNGSIKNFLVCPYKFCEQFEDAIKFNCFETDESNGKNFVEFSGSKASILSIHQNKVEFGPNGEISLSNAHITFKELEAISEHAFDF